MVMVANKKTKEQMTDDLSLFLGKNTDRFTTWYVLVVRMFYLYDNDMKIDLFTIIHWQTLYYSLFEC
jgi:hypothetical protein